MIPSSAQPKVEYANWWSKALFAKSFDNQFTIPVPPGKGLIGSLKLLERTLLKADVSALKIDRPVFIVGLPRSGTSMLYNVLCAHERAAYVTNSMNSFPEAIIGIEWIRKKLHFNIRGERFLQDSVDTD